MQLELVQASEPVAQASEAVVAVRAVGICGSDIHGLTGITGRRKPGMVWGHEASGIITALGPGVSDFKVDDRVVIFPNRYCGSCTNCRQGRTNICLQRQALGVNFPGAFADLVKVPGWMLRRLPDQISYEVGALVEPLAVAIHAADHIPNRLMDTVVIVGAGTIGLLIILCARLAGAGTVVITDKSEHRLAVAREIGADVAVNVDEQSPLDVVLDITNGEGADVAIEAVGYSATAQQAISVVRPGGHVAWLGNSTPLIEINMQDVVLREVTISGLLCYTTAEFDKAIAAIETSKMKVDTLIEARVGLEEAPPLAVELAKGTCDLVKALILP